MKPFNLITAPIAGKNLIEASAGTGKTYTIAGIYLRLVLEKGVLPEKILVVTFTEAAAQELKDRIRERLSKALSDFEKGRPSDQLIKDLADHYQKTGAKIHINNLREAVRNFDAARVFTIHGFSRRILVENAFESGGFFDMELLTDAREAVNEIVTDFYRRNVSIAPRLFAGFLVREKKISPSAFITLFLEKNINPEERILPDVQSLAHVPTAWDAAEKAYRSAFSEAKSSFDKNMIEAVLLEDKGLNRQKYKSPSIKKRLDELAVFLEGPADIWPAFKTMKKPVDMFNYFSMEKIAVSMKKGFSPPDHPFFHAMDVLRNAYEDFARLQEKRFILLKLDFFRESREMIETRKKEYRFRTFDDLLLDLFYGLKSPGGRLLKQSVREKYDAALIDEFQDTDPVQNAIFDMLFGQNTVFYMIGDPKQSIYRFRGADIFSYMEAARNCIDENRRTLSHNWRSEPGLIAAVNAVFQRKKHPFVFEEIPFNPVFYPQDKPESPFRYPSGDQAPLKIIRQVDGDVNKTQSQKLIAEDVARRILKILEQSGKGFGGIEKNGVLSPVSAGDIAVLTRTHREAGIIRDALSRRSIPAVLYQTADVFETEEAFEMELVLNAILFPEREIPLKTALSTRMLGKTAHEMDALFKDEHGWNALTARFMEYRDIWKERGVAALLRIFLEREKVLERQAGYVNGERRVTNVLHLAELLHHTEYMENPGTAGLLKWLAQKRLTNGERRDEHVLRLESDASAVKIVTVHKSKGLEYAVVFLPYMWSAFGSPAGDRPVVFHDETCGLHPTCIIDPELGVEYLTREALEIKAENTRLFYVALTRARHKCYLYWDMKNESDRSPVSEVLVEDGEDKTESLEKLVEAAGGMISVGDVSGEDFTEDTDFIPERYGVTPEDYFRFKGKMGRPRRIWSYSGLVHSAGGGREADETTRIDFSDAFVKRDEPETNQATEVKKADGPVDNPFDVFPAGATAGLFIHEVLETFDFSLSFSHEENQQETRPDDIRSARESIGESLLKWRFDPELNPAVENTLDIIRRIPLAEGKARLMDIPMEETIRELRFHFPVAASGDFVSLMKRRGDFDPDAAAKISRISLSGVEGFMKGFIDFIFRYPNNDEGKFYILDWKSNYLGDSFSSYGPENLKREMERSLYVLQYYIYTAALVRYLSLRMPGFDYDAHFGGAYYVFIRGLSTDLPENGVFFDRPDKETTEELLSLLESK